MKKALVFLTVLALLVQPALTFDQPGHAQEGPDKIHLPLVIGGSGGTAPPSGEWSSQEKAAIASIANNAGVVTPLAPDENTVETEETRDDTYEYFIEKHHVVDNIDSIYYLGLNDDIIWPGSLLRGDTIHDFLYTPILTPRAPVWISVNLETVSCAGNLAKQVSDPNLHNMRNGVRELLQTARNNCTTIPAAVSFEYQRVYNESQMNLFVGANVKYGAGSLDTKFNWSDATKKTKIMAKYQQIYYTVDITTPTSPAAFFDPTRTTVNEIGADLPAGSKPVYVAGVKYGMMALMFLESSYSEESMDFALNAAYNDGLTEVDVTTQLTAQDIMESSNIRVVVYGGSTAGLGELETGLPGFMKVIHASMDAGPDSPGVPLVYKFRHLTDNTLALVTLTSDYAIKTQFPLMPKIRVTLIKFKATMVDDEGPTNTVDMDRFYLKATAYNRASADEDPGTPAQSPLTKYVVNWSTSGEYDMDAGDEWPAPPAKPGDPTLQGTYYLDIQYNNMYPYGPGNWDYAYLKLEAGGRDYDGPLGTDDWGSGSKILLTGADILAVVGDKPLFEITSSDFRMDVYVKIELLNP
jgi:Thiol-activated cytolysin